MSMYKRSTPTERTRQLVEHINRYHEEFCKTDDPDKKLECLRLLKGYGTEYLNQVPHSQKFRTQRVEGVLTQSVYNLTDFDPREASEAFEHLAKYGQNLLEQPWREEFRTICLASGYYVHNIQTYLLNPHEILIAMGYTNIDDSTLILATVPNPSYLKEVARDCFLASQECLVLSQIWDFVRTSTKYDVTCSEIYQYRREYVGDTQTIGQKICFDLRQRAYEESMKLQQKLSRQPSVYSQKNNSYDNTCPVETLVDVDSAMNGMKVGEMPEREIVQKVLRNTQRQQLHHHTHQPENIYDPVADFDDLNFQPIKHQQQQQQPHHAHHLSPESPSINSYFDTSSSYNNTPSDFGLPEVTPLQYNRYNSQTRSSTTSPYIPQTVSAFSSVLNNVENEGFHHRKPTSNCGSSSSGSGGYNQYPSNPSALPLQYRKVSEDEFLRSGIENHSRGTNNVLDYPNWLEMEKNKHKYSSTVMGANVNSRSNEGKDTLSTSLNADNCLQEAFKYKSGVRELISDGRKPIESYNHRPQGYSQKDSNTLTTSNGRSNKSSTDNSSRVSSERESENNNKSSASSSEASSWGYSQSYITEPSKITTESISSSRKKSLDKSQFPSSSSHNPSTTTINKGMYETEHKQNYSQQQQQQYKETNLDTCENVFFQKLLSEGKDNYKTNNNNNNTSTTTHHTTQQENTNTGMHTSSSFTRSNNVKKGEHRETDLDAFPHESSHVEVDGKVLITSVDDETSWIKVDTNISPPNTSKRGTVPSSSSSSMQHLQQQQQQEEEEEIEIEREQDQAVVVVTPWTCPHCTYCNYTSENVCEVCAKSKDFVFKEAPIPATSNMPKLYSTGGESKSVSSSKHARSNSSGGGTLKGLSKDNQISNRSKAKSPEDDGMINCPQCTVLNPKFRVICELCECRLKNRGED